MTYGNERECKNKNDNNNVSKRMGVQFRYLIFFIRTIIFFTCLIALQNQILASRHFSL